MCWKVVGKGGAAVATFHPAAGHCSREQAPNRRESAHLEGLCWVWGSGWGPLGHQRRQRCKQLCSQQTEETELYQWQELHPSDNWCTETIQLSVSGWTVFDMTVYIFFLPYFSFSSPCFPSRRESRCFSFGPRKVLHKARSRDCLQNIFLLVFGDFESVPLEQGVKFAGPGTVGGSQIPEEVFAWRWWCVANPPQITWGDFTDQTLRRFDGADGTMKHAYDAAKTHGTEAFLLTLSSSCPFPVYLSKWGCLLPSRVALYQTSLDPFPFGVDLLGWFKFHSNVILDS